MRGFERSWLALREPVDHTARSGALAARFAAALAPAPRLIDLACGTGSNLRYLSPRLGPEQHWTCLDHDRALLACAADAIAEWGEARGLAPTRPLAMLLELKGAQVRSTIALIERDLCDAHRAFGLERAHGLTASAFLDLISAAWADHLAERLRGAAVPVLFALTYDGRLEWRPDEQDDREVAERFNRHQRTDKGFGPALGPDAAPWLAKRLEAADYQVELGSSDWHLDAVAEPALLRAFLDGLIEAAREVEDDLRLAGWAKLRRRQVNDGRLGLRVGHLDLLALPGARGRAEQEWARLI